MARFPLKLELGSFGPSLLRVACLLRQDPRLRLQVGSVRFPQLPPAKGVLRLELGSWVRPLATLLWGVEEGDRGGASEVEQAALGASGACWSEPDSYGNWYRAACSLRGRLRMGEPDVRKPWVLIAPGIRLDEGELGTPGSLQNAQPHVLRPVRGLRRLNAVLWMPTPRTIQALLGHVDAVWAPNGPLAWDARRAGCPLLDFGATAGVPDDLAQRRLAHIVPEELLGDAPFWRAIVSDLVNGCAPSGWGTLPWLRLARAYPRHQSSSSRVRLQRKLLKLRYDPQGFWSDSKLARVAGFSRRQDE